jgi:transcriptional regulator with XRE-family HTH domain
MEVGDRLRLLRQKLGLTQSQMAQKLGVTLNTYQRYELGNRNLTVEKLQQLRKLFGVNLNWLLTGEGGMFESYNDKEKVKQHLRALKSIVEELERECG